MQSSSNLALLFARIMHGREQAGALEPGSLLIPDGCKPHEARARLLKLLRAIVDCQHLVVNGCLLHCPDVLIDSDFRSPDQAILRIDTESSVSPVAIAALPHLIDMTLGQAFSASFSPAGAITWKAEGGQLISVSAAQILSAPICGELQSNPSNQELTQ